LKVENIQAFQKKGTAQIGQPLQLDRK